METDSVINRKIKNHVCIICGAAFKQPRAGKLFCSARCKQFQYYHKEEIKELEQSQKGINNEAHRLNIKEFDLYCSIFKQVSEYRSLNKKSMSPYLKLSSEELSRYLDLNDQIPDYLKTCQIPELSLEEWSFIKLLYPSLRKDEFFRLVNNLGLSFFNRLVYDGNDKKKGVKENAVASLYGDHIFKIASGKIVFV